MPLPHPAMHCNVPSASDLAGPAHSIVALQHMKYVFDPCRQDPVLELIEGLSDLVKVLLVALLLEGEGKLIGERDLPRIYNTYATCKRLSSENSSAVARLAEQLLAYNLLTVLKPRSTSSQVRGWCLVPS